MQVLKEFNGTCNNESFTYKVLRVHNELLLESYKEGEYMGRLTWHDTTRNEKLVNEACKEIEARV